MNDLSQAIQHLRAAQPHMKAMGDALNRHARPDELTDIADFIGGAGLLECKHIINELIDRVSTLTGCADKLEDAACALTREIEAEARAET